MEDTAGAQLLFPTISIQGGSDEEEERRHKYHTIMSP